MNALSFVRALALVWALLGAVPTAWAQAALSPPTIDMTLDGRGGSRTEAFRWINDSPAPMRIEVSVSHWTLDAAGAVTLIPPTEQSLAPWLAINPTAFTVPPGQSQVVRFAVRPSVVLTPGEHRAMVFFTQVPLPGSTPDPASLHLYARFGAAVYAHVGPVQAAGTLGAVTADARAAVFPVRNTGNATIRLLGDYTLQPERRDPPPGAGTRQGPLPRDAVLPGTARPVRLAWGTRALPPGAYVLRVQGRLGDTPFEQRVRFTVPAHPAAVAAR